MKNWYVYIVRCSDNTLYTGITVDVEARVQQHNLCLGAKYTRARIPVKLVYSEKAKNRSEATKRELKIKKMSRRSKMELINEVSN